MHPRRSLAVTIIVTFLAASNASGENETNTSTLSANNSLPDMPAYGSRVHNATAHLHNATVRLRALCVNGSRLTRARCRRYVGVAAVGLRTSIAASQTWLKEAAKTVVEDAQVAATQHAQAFGDAANDLRKTISHRFRAWTQRSRAVSRILLRTRQRRFYDVLQVRRRAAKKQLKDAYRRLAKRVHPDKTRDERAERAFNELRDAFDFLSDERKRHRYDEELAKQDLATRQRRQRQRQVAYRLSARVLRRLWAWAWLHRKWTAPVAALLLVRFLL